MKKQVLIPFILWAIALVGCQSCHKVNANNDENAFNTEGGAKKEKFCISDTLAHMIQIDSVKTEPMLDELQLSGEVSFNQDKVVRVLPLASGQVLEVKAQLGDYVSKGQTLAVIKSTEGVSNFNEKRAVETDVAIAKKNMDAAESLAKSGMGTQRDFDLAKENYQRALVAVDRINEMQKIYGGGNAGGLVTISAPASGYILEKKVSTGSIVRPDNVDNLFTIGDINDVWVLANVFESDISRVREGLSVDIKTLAYPNVVFKGTISKIGEMLDPVNKALKVRIRLNNSDHKLKPEMFTTVLVHHTEGVSAAAIPTSALVFDFGKQYIVVYKSKCDVTVREVSVLKTVGDRTYLASGANVGEQIITHNQILVYQSFKE
jgi:membrane fusion protein, heavy metal efflux system